MTQASTVAGQVDALFVFLVAVSLFFATLIFVLIAWFAVKYRQRAGREKAERVRTHYGLEATWIGVPAMLTVVMFVWGAKLFFHMNSPPPDAMQVFVVGKQWMWKFQHPEGRQEINELHVPRGRPVRLTMISEDVIHDLFVPAFRVKKDVLPGRYSGVWFEATKTGAYRLLCSQYCGTQHSKMNGWVYVMEPAEYEKWLSGADEPMAIAGKRLYERLGCAACHLPEDSARGPSLVGLYGKRVRLQNGQTIVARDDYIRESIMNPQARLTAGYPPVMSTFKGIVTEEGTQQLIAYIKSL